MSAAMTMDDHPVGGSGDLHHGALPECCVLGACTVLPPVAPPFASMAEPNGFGRSASPVLDDNALPGRSPSPDLRPPIA
jgi:hypothetical protein